MRQTLKPGAELDLLTRDEMQQVLREALESLARTPLEIRAEKDAPTTAAGFAEWCVYRVPQGMKFILTRVFVTIDGASVAVPFTGAGAMLEVLRNDVVIDFKSLVAAAVTPAGLPALIKDSDSSGATFSNGDELKVRLTAVTASSRALARIEGFLQPVTTD